MESATWQSKRMASQAGWGEWVTQGPAPLLVLPPSRLAVTSEDQSHLEPETDLSLFTWGQWPPSMADITGKTWGAGSARRSLSLRHGAWGPNAVDIPVWHGEEARLLGPGLQLMATPSASGWVVECQGAGQPLDCRL